MQASVAKVDSLTEALNSLERSYSAAEDNYIHKSQELEKTCNKIEKDLRTVEQALQAAIALVDLLKNAVMIVEGLIIEAEAELALAIASANPIQIASATSRVMKLRDILEKLRNFLADAEKVLDECQKIVHNIRTCLSRCKTIHENYVSKGTKTLNDFQEKIRIAKERLNGARKELEAYCASHPEHDAFEKWIHWQPSSTYSYIHLVEIIKRLDLSLNQLYLFASYLYDNDCEFRTLFGKTQSKNVQKQKALCDNNNDKKIVLLKNLFIMRLMKHSLKIFGNVLQSSMQNHDNIKCDIMLVKLSDLVKPILCNNGNMIPKGGELFFLVMVTNDVHKKDTEQIYNTFSLEVNGTKVYLYPKKTDIETSSILLNESQNNELSNKYSFFVLPDDKDFEQIMESFYESTKGGVCK